VIVQTRGELAAQLVQAARQAGFEVVPVPIDELSRSDRLAGRCELLLLPEAGAVPYAAFESIMPYLKSGGALVALGGPLWPAPAVRVGGHWMRRSDWQRECDSVRPQRVLLDFRSEDWQRWSRATSHPNVAATWNVIDDAPGRALHVSVADMQGWDTLLRGGISTASGHTFTCFRAKGDSRTRQLSVEWDEKDGSRWIATVELFTEWRHYALPLSAFKAWPPGSGRRLNLANATRLAVGLSRLHTPGVGVGPHEYCFADLGTAPGRDIDSDADLPAILSLSPWDQFYPIHGPVQISTHAAAQSLQPDTPASDVALESPAVLGLHPRAGSAGFDKNRPWRWQPLLVAHARQGDYRGAIAALLVHLQGAYCGGAWAVFTPSDPRFYRQPTVESLLVRVMSRLRGGLLLQEGGAACYTHFEDQPVRLGARVLSVGRSSIRPRADVVHIEITPTGGHKPSYQRDWPVAPKPGEPAVVGDAWQPKAWPAGGFQVVTELRENGKTTDCLSHEIHVLHPRARPQFLQSRDGGFWLNGKPWKAHGINYMPSSGIAMPRELYPMFEYWLSAAAYDPAVIDRDLHRVRAIGFNAVSVFLDHRDLKGQNLLDLLRRCDALGLHVNLSLRPGTPMEFPWNQVREMIEFNRLAGNDTVFAYDLAWEPWHGPYVARKKYGADWARWIESKYGSIAAAEKAWGVPLPRDGGQPSVPPKVADGPQRRLSLDYLAFLDDLLAQRYGEARRLIRSIDPNHAVSFRMTEAGNPLLFHGENFPYELYGLRRAVDIWEPEGYGRIGEWDSMVKPGRFTVAYARLCGPSKPVIWAEAGFPLYGGARPAMPFPPLDDRLAAQASFYRSFYRLLRESGSDGIFWWWYAGGCRIGEDSDFGILEPDGTDRPVTRVIREEGPRFLATPKRPFDCRITVVYAADVRGLFGIYERVKDAFWKAVSAGKTPGLSWSPH
jgi:hypothetical protein